MQIRPILSSLRRNKLSAILIALQIALTIAILCNCLFVIQQRLALSQRPSGAAEEGVFVINNQWVDEKETNLTASLHADLALLRSLPGVIDAYATNSLPLTNHGSTVGCNLQPDQVSVTARCAVYFADEHGLQTLGLKLISGRNFVSSEVNDLPSIDSAQASAVIITRELAQQLFQGGPVAGRSIYLQFQSQRIQVVGVVDKLQVPWTSATGWGSTFNDNSVIEPFRYIAQSFYYVVRAKPNQLAQVMREAHRSLINGNRARVLERIRPLSEARADAYRDDRGLTLILTVVCTALLSVTALGIVGISSYWVVQRRRQIGIRRALGATRRAIVEYFQTENLIIVSTGAVIGVFLALGLNLWMIRNYALARLPLYYAPIGALTVLLLAQLAVLWPAQRAASIPPALAVRES
jgi:putative ABC transport system permease protein